ncbi:MAG: O-antigen ligase family protein [Phenylobacterium sp.]|nr:O-antigen ligase family protein [Phenylobacterium sp.]
MAADAAPLTPRRNVTLAGYRRPPPPRWRNLVLYAALAVTFVTWGVLFGISAPFRIMPLVAPIPLVALMLVWALPEGDYAPTSAIKPLFLGFFVSLVLWPNYLAISLPGLPWITMLRLFIFPLTLAILICVSVSQDFRKTIWQPFAHTKVFIYLLLPFLFLQTISLALSDRPATSLNKYFVEQLYHTLIIFVSCYLFLKPGFATRWALMFLAMVYVVCAIGLWEASIGVLPWAGHIPPFLKIETDIVANILDGAVRHAIGAHRVQAMSSQPLVMAELLGLAAPFALHIGLGRHHLAVRIAAYIYLPLALVLIELADSRLGMVALLSAVLFYLLFWAALRWRHSAGSIFAPAIVLSYPLIMLMTLFATFTVGRLRTAVWGSGAHQASSDSRGTQWALATPKIATHPVGHGIGEAGREVGFFSPSGKPTLDSYYINILMDYGPLGFVLYFGLILYVAWRAGLTAVDHGTDPDISILIPIAVALLQFVIIKSVLSLDANHSLVFMMLGGAIALIYRAKLKSDAAATGAGTSSVRA